MGAVPVNFFKPFECTEVNLSKLVRKDAPGVYALVEKGPDGAPRWCYVGRADNDLIPTLADELLNNPTSQVRAALEAGALVCTSVVRDAEERNAAYAYLCTHLNPRIRAGDVQAAPTQDVLLRIVAGQAMYPTLT